MHGRTGELGDCQIWLALVCVAGEAMQEGTPIAVCSTSNERAVSTIVRVLLGPEVASQMRVFAGDVVPKKKPAPDIYILAAKELGVDPRMCALSYTFLPSEACCMTCILDLHGGSCVQACMHAGLGGIPHATPLAGELILAGVKTGEEWRVCGSTGAW